jgi:CheY-like chemotaxis protein
VQLSHLIGEMTGIMRETFPREIVIEQRITGNLAPIKGDPTQLHQVILNLCVNARDAMPDGGKLLITAKNVEVTDAEAQNHAPAKAGAYVAVTVADTGHGMSAEIISRIFEPFYTTKALTKGTGLGLSTAVGIIRSHHGFLTVASIPGNGAAFTVYLPVASNVVEAAAIPLAELRRGDGELILLVDDEASIRTVTRLLLERNGYRVLTACEGAEGLVAFMKNRDEVRIVLTDVMMPVMGGMALIEALRTADPNLKIIAMSGLDDHANHAALRAAGVSCVLPKPCGLRDLLAAVEAQLIEELRPVS